MKLYFTSYSVKCYILQIIEYMKNPLDILIHFKNYILQITEDESKLEVVCQHGPEECYADKIHACSIRNNPTKTWLGFIACTTEKYQPYVDTVAEKVCIHALRIFRFGQWYSLKQENGVEIQTIPSIFTENSHLYVCTENNSKYFQCAKQFNLSWDTLKSCANGDEGEKIFLQYGEMTRNAEVNYTPFITYNGVHDTKIEDNITDNFVGTACSLLKNKPDVCNNL